MENHDSGFDTFEIDLSAVSWRREESGFGSFGFDVLTVGWRPEGTGSDLFGFDLSQVSRDSLSLNWDQMVLESICLGLIYQL